MSAQHTLSYCGREPVFIGRLVLAKLNTPKELLSLGRPGDVQRRASLVNHAE